MNSMPGKIGLVAVASLGVSYLFSNQSLTHVAEIAIAPIFITLNGIPMTSNEVSGNTSQNQDVGVTILYFASSHSAK